MIEKTKLTGDREKTVTWVWRDPTGGPLKVEYYDFSEDAQRFFGNDIAYTLTVTEMKKLVSRSKQDDTSLVQWLTQNFKSYFDLKTWLEENQIGFRVDTESWA